MAKYKSASIILGGAGLIYSGICAYRGDEKFYNAVLMPAMRSMNPELSHNISLQMMKYGIYPRMQKHDYNTLECNVLGLSFDNPLGLAAGCDKNGLAIHGFGELNFGFVEIGSVTPIAQEGNPKPRIFRLLNDRAVINRLGFNNEGFEEVYQRLERYRNNVKALKSNHRPIIGVNIGKNRDSESFFQDYVEGITKFAPLADYLVINISSPNTAGLRDLQKQEFLGPLLEQIKKRKLQLIHGDFAKQGNPRQFPKIFLKLSPDMTAQERRDVARTILKCKDTIDGVIISNTTVERPSTLKSELKLTQQVGGLSGVPLKEKSTNLIKEFYENTKGVIPIIGVGGISSGADAYAKIKSGASLIQLYTGLLYHGPPLVPKILKELDELVKKDGYKTISQAVGVDVKTK